MAGRTASTNALVVTSKGLDTSLNVQLHPLVLLTISDYITRHTLRQQEGPIIGAIIGQQNGRTFTLEHAFQCKLANTTDEILLDEEWFSKRLEMYKEVHKVPSLDLVALFTLGPVEGPQPAHLPALSQVQTITNSDNIMLLLFHPQLVDNLQGGKLPISLYESLKESENDQTKIRFRELTFEVETGDAEMIGVDFVAKGGGNATAVPKADTTAAPSSSSASTAADKKKTKGKGKAKEKDDEEVDAQGVASTSAVLSPEDDELIAALTAKINSIKMLNERVNLIRTYLTSLQPSYLTDASSTTSPSENTNFALLRSVGSMLSRIPLLAPPTTTQTDDSATALKHASEMEKQDVHLTSLLASLTRSVSEAQSMGAKFGVLQREKTNKERSSQMGRGARFGVFNVGDESILADGSGL